MAHARSPKAFWEIHDRIGEIELGPHSRLLVSAVMREGTWYVRLCPYRLAQQDPSPQWVAANQVILFPPAVVAPLCALLHDASVRAQTAAAAPGELTPDELEQETGVD